MKTALCSALLIILPCAGMAEISAFDVYIAAARGEVLVFNETSPHPTRVKASLGKVSSGGYSLQKLRSLAHGKARKYGISPRLFEAIIWAESNFDPACLGAAGEYSLGQIMPGTWAGLAAAGRLQNPWVPEENLEGAAKYIKDSYSSLTPKDLSYAARMGYTREHLVLCLYNGGRGTLNRHVNSGRPLSPKLLAYVGRVVNIHNHKLGGTRGRR